MGDGILEQMVQEQHVLDAFKYKLQEELVTQDIEVNDLKKFIDTLEGTIGRKSGDGGLVPRYRKIYQPFIERGNVIIRILNVKEGCFGGVFVLLKSEN